MNDFGMDESKSADYSTISKEDQLKGYEMMQLCRQFENACNQAYMQGKIRGFMHLDNGQVRLGSGRLESMLHAIFSVARADWAESVFVVLVIRKSHI